MRLSLFLLMLSLFLFSCKSGKTLKNKNSHTVLAADKVTDSIKTINTLNFETEPATETDAPSESSNKAFNIIDFAKQFEGVKYKFGGTTKKGMDCSGLVYETFKAFDISLPRISREMAKEGVQVYIDDVKEGDLLFFKTTKKRNIISHVGLVVTALPGNIEFIHSTTNQGVIISSLAERYWYYSFSEARRIL
ncbi:C40 family peptidase [Gaetbulibacter aquiaggeris]|uniref:C40 family peptidase n=1 Tax=Gaetbulibacter aquiaggeris TaxID=1735373 RepID=A0ABW7MM75_9FLAO